MYLTHTPFDYIPGGNATALLSRDRQSIAKNIVFIYPQTYKDLIDRLGTLHTWMKPPSIIIIDSLHAFGGPLANPSDKDAQAIALLIAMLLDVASVFRMSTSKCLTILSINRQIFTVDFLQKLIQIYYYSNKYLTMEGESLLNALNKFI